MSDLFSPRAPARNESRETSLLAADSVHGARIAQAQKHILAIIRDHGPIGDNEILSRCEIPISPSGARTRRSELVERRLVRDSGKRETLETGRKAILWEVA